MADIRRIPMPAAHNSQLERKSCDAVSKPGPARIVTASCELDMLVADILKVPARVWHAIFSGLLAYDETGELTRVGAPTLLIWGDDDALAPREMQEVLTDRLPHAELIVYPAVGHTPRWADPQRFSEDLAAFVERLQAGP